MSRCYRVVCCTAVLAAALPASARATLDVVTTSPAPVTAVMSSDGRFVAWTDGESGISVRDRVAAQTEEYTFNQLRPSTAATVLVALDLYAIDDSGRWLTYRAGRGGDGAEAFLVRFDRLTSERFVIESRGHGSRPLPAAVSRDARTVAWLEWAGGRESVRVMVRTADADAPFQIGTTCLSPHTIGTPCIAMPAVSGDGTTVFYTAGDRSAEALAAYDVASAQVTYFPQVRPTWPSVGLRPEPAIVSSNDGRFVIARSAIGGLFDRTTTRLDQLAERLETDQLVAVSDDGAAVLVRTLGLVGLLGRSRG